MIKGVAAILAVILIAIAALSVSGFDFGQFLSVSNAQCQDIYAYYAAFRCCDEEMTSSGVKEMSMNEVWQCPTYAERCEVSISPGSSVVWRGTENCKIQLLGDFQCDDRRRVSSADDIAPGEYVYSQNWALVYLTYKIFDGKLCDCPLNPCGLPCPRVPGSAGCGFDSTDDIFLSNGLTDAFGGYIWGDLYHYTVPEGECYTYYPETNRHPVGNTCETCDDANDCASQYPLRYNYGGTSYGAICQGNSVQLYDCMPTGGSICIRFRDANENNVQDSNEECLETGSKSRCDLFKSIPIQCCPGTSSCGPQAFCGDDYVCHQTAECDNDYDCGSTIVCDRATLTLKDPICQSGSCTFDERPVECCYDSDCSEGYYCDYPDYTCKEKPDDKTDCPHECCDGEEEYFDRRCPGTDVCCGDNTCAASTEACDIPPPPPDDALILVVLILTFAALVGLIGYKIGDKVVAVIGAIIGGLIGYLIHWLFFDLAWWQQLLLLLGLGGLGAIGVYVIIAIIAIVAPIIMVLLMRE